MGGVFSRLVFGGSFSLFSKGVFPRLALEGISTLGKRGDISPLSRLGVFSRLTGYIVSVNAHLPYSWLDGLSVSSIELDYINFQFSRTQSLNPQLLTNPVFFAQQIHPLGHVTKRHLVSRYIHTQTHYSSLLHL